MNTCIVADIENDLTQLNGDVKPEELRRRIYYIVEFLANAEKLSRTKVDERPLTLVFKSIDSSTYILV